MKAATYNTLRGGNDNMTLITKPEILNTTTMHSVTQPYTYTHTTHTYLFSAVSV